MSSRCLASGPRTTSQACRLCPRPWKSTSSGPDPTRSKANPTWTYPPEGRPDQASLPSSRPRLYSYPRYELRSHESLRHREVAATRLDSAWTVAKALSDAYDRRLALSRPTVHADTDLAVITGCLYGAGA